MLQTQGTKPPGPASYWPRDLRHLSKEMYKIMKWFIDRQNLVANAEQDISEMRSVLVWV